MTDKVRTEVSHHVLWLKSRGKKKDGVNIELMLDTYFKTTTAVWKRQNTWEKTCLHWQNKSSRRGVIVLKLFTLLFSIKSEQARLTSMRWIAASPAAATGDQAIYCFGVFYFPFPPGLWLVHDMDWYCLPFEQIKMVDKIREAILLSCLLIISLKRS